MEQPGGVRIEPETADDAAAVHEVVRRAFAEQQSVADLVRLVRRSPHHEPGLALVARAGEAVVGFVMLSHAEVVDDRVRHDVLTLSPLAVLPRHQGRGVGAALVLAGLAAADAAGHGLVVLEGSPRYYGRLGFEPASAHGVVVDLPSWAPPEAAQVRRLTAYDPRVKGRLVYPRAFGVVAGA